MLTEKMLNTEKTNAPPPKGKANEALHAALTDWLLQNFVVPIDTSTLIAFIIAAILAWYIINWVVNILMIVVWPFVITTLVISLVPYIREGNLQCIVPNVIESFKGMLAKLGQMGQCFTVNTR